MFNLLNRKPDTTPRHRKHVHDHGLKKLPKGYLPHSGTEPPVEEGALVMLAIRTAHGISTAGPKRTARTDNGQPIHGACVHPCEWAMSVSEFGSIAGYLPVEEKAETASPL